MLMMFAQIDFHDVTQALIALGVIASAVAAILGREQAKAAVTEAKEARGEAQKAQGEAAEAKKEAQAGRSEIKSELKTVSESMNGQLQQLLKVTERAAKLEGNKEGRDETENKGADLHDIVKGAMVEAAPEAAAAAAPTIADAIKEAIKPPADTT